MRTIRIKIADVLGLEGGSHPDNPDTTALQQTVLKQFGFLPQEVQVHAEGDEVVVQFPEGSPAVQEEASRLLERAAEHAPQGNYQKAISLYKRVLELQPHVYEARRDLAMAYMEIGDVENAAKRLSEALLINPRDAWGWVVLGNLYTRKKADKDTAEKFFRKALEISPNDPWALNSLAAVYCERGRMDEAMRLFDRAIAADPEFANPYYGKALALASNERAEVAIEMLERMFERAKMQDVRSKPVFDSARELYGKLQATLAERNESQVFKLVQTYKTEMEALSGFPIQIQEGDFASNLGATIQMAWKHQRSFHLLKIRSNYPAPLACHLECHELTHLKLECEARKVGKNLFYITTPRTRETAIRAMEADIRKWHDAGLSEEQITRSALDLANGLCQFLFNCPLDMLIERQLREMFLLLRPAQFLSLRLLADEARRSSFDSQVRRFAPRKVLEASLALNGAYALFLDDLFGGAVAFAKAYEREDAFKLSKKIWAHWQQRERRLGPGDEYQLVDEFADILGLRGWYEWQPDPVYHDTAKPIRQGVTNPALLKQKHPAAVFYFLDALQRFERMTPAQIRDIAFEIALLGRSGLDYASSEQKYELRTLPGQKFTGLHLMCLMYAGFKRLAPEQDLGVDLNEPVLNAFELFNNGRKEGH